MLSLNQILKLRRSAWAVLPDVMESLITASESVLAGDISQKDAADMLEAARSTAKPRANQTIQVIPIHGLMMPRGSCCFGALGTVDLRRMINDAAADPKVAGIILDVDSPGGRVTGTPELGNAIAAAAAVKPTWAVATGMAASAAYWSGSQAGRFYASPSADVGSIGVVATHIDESKALHDAGLKATFITAGRYKVEANSFEPLSEEARKHIQETVNESYQEFLEAVARGRSVASGRSVTPAMVQSDMGEGRMLSATRALEANMIDGIATFDEVVALMRSEISNATTGRGRVAEASTQLGGGDSRVSIEELARIFELPVELVSGAHANAGADEPEPLTDGSVTADDAIDNSAAEGSPADTTEPDPPPEPYVGSPEWRARRIKTI